MKKLNLICIFLIWVLCSSAQGFISRYKLPIYTNHISKSMFAIGTNSYMTMGLAADSNGVTYLQAMGLNNQGQLLWTKSYGSNKFYYGENFYSIRSCYEHQGSIYYTGVGVDSTGGICGLLVKFNSNGDTLWQRIYRDTVDEIVPQGLTKSVDGGFLITGFFEGQTAQPCMLIKTDINGKELWRKKIYKSVPNVSDGKAIIQDSASKKIAIVGYQYIGNSNNWDNFENLLILDSVGNVKNQLNYDQSIPGFFLDLIQTKDGYFVAAGLMEYKDNQNRDRLYPTIVKFDINNPSQYIWRVDSTDGVTAANAFACLTEFPNGDILVSGEYDTVQISVIQANVSIRYVRLSPTGNLIWKKHYTYNTTPGSLYQAGIRDLHITSDKGWIAAIEVANALDNNPFLFVKYDSTGCDSSLAYCQMIASGIAKNYLQSTSISLYPNPTNGELHVSMSGIHQNDQIILSIADVSGRVLKTIKFPSPNEQVINIKDLTAGVYLVTITEDGNLVYKTKLVKEN